MRDDHDGRLELLAQLRQGLDHDGLVALVELGRRLIGEDNPSLARSGGSDRDPLLLTARERSGALSFAPVQPERRQSPVGLGGRIPPAGKAKGELDVLAGRKIRPQVAALEHESDLGRPVGGELLLTEPRQRAAERADLTRRGLVEAGRQVERRALARARWPEDRHQLARLDAKLEPAQRHCLGGAGAVDLEHVVELERPEGDLRAFRLAPEASHLHLKLSIISR